MDTVRAKLTVVLKADDVVVAEAENAVLWQRVLAAINTGAPAVDAIEVRDHAVDAGMRRENDKGPLLQEPLDGPTDAVGRLAAQLGLPRAVIEGAIDPAADAPYVHLNAHCWQEFKRQVPERGSRALAPIAVGATLLALWFRVAALGTATQAQVQKVLQTIHVSDHNPGRGLQRATWLQSRAGGLILINPAEISTAESLTRCFCSKDWNEWNAPRLKP